jgi:drug/metabolite transporter (DMT)-like permease
VQLVVPVFAALGGIILLAEQSTARLAIASALILGGVGAAVLADSSAP